MISVIVCTFNRARALQKMLDSFFRQRQLDQVPHELLIIDNNSNDDTAAVVREFLREEGTRYFFEANQGLSFARNRGFTEARGEFISFLDDDVLVNEDWLSSLKACFDQTRADVVGGKVSLRFEVPPEKWLGGLFRKCLSEVDLGDSRKILSDGDCLYGANLSFRRKTLDSVGLFETNAGRSGHGLVSGEETQVVRKIRAIKGRIVYDPDASVEHLIGAERLQWQYFVKRAGGDGVTLEFLEPRKSRGYQALRVCKAAMDLLNSGYSRYTMFSRTDDSYQRKLAQFLFVRQRSYLTARLARLVSSG